MALSLILAACSGLADRPKVGPGGAPTTRSTELAVQQKLLGAYDLDKDGSLSRDELEAGLKKDFADIDTNHDGRLSAAEVAVENDRRWRVDGPQSTPLIDWNHDGWVDLDEFANATRTLFGQLDTDVNGVLTRQEMRGPGENDRPAPGRPVPRGGNGGPPGRPEPGP